MHGQTIPRKARTAAPDDDDGRAQLRLDDDHDDDHDDDTDSDDDE